MNNEPEAEVITVTIEGFRPRSILGLSLSEALRLTMRAHGYWERTSHDVVSVALPLGQVNKMLARYEQWEVVK